MSKNHCDKQEQGNTQCEYQIGLRIIEIARKSLTYVIIMHDCIQHNLIKEGERGRLRPKNVVVRQHHPINWCSSSRT